MTKTERLKLIQLGLPYIITKPQQEEILEQQNFTLEIIDRLSDYSDKQLDNAIKINNPSEAIIESYKRPISYQNYILLNGKVVIRFK